MKRLGVWLILPESVEEIDADALEQAEFSVVADGIPHSTVPALLAATAEAIIRAEVGELSEPAAARADITDALVQTSARLRLVDEVMHLPDSTRQIQVQDGIL